MDIFDITHKSATYLKRIDQLLGLSLSDLQLADIIGFPISIISYSDFHLYDNIYECFGSYDCFIVLYQREQNYGHWCCVLLHRDSNQTPYKVEFFDSYGVPVDLQLDQIDPKFRKAHNMDRTHLGWLIYDSKLKIEYNHYPLQYKSPDINTCGRWCAMRILSHHIMTLDEFIQWVNRPLNFSCVVLSNLVDQIPKFKQIYRDIKMVLLTQPFL